MTRKINDGAAFAVILLLVSAPPTVADQASYAEAHAQAVADTSTPAGKEYESTKFIPYYQEHHAKSLETCFAHFQKPDPAPFTFVIVLDAKGKPTTFHVDRDTNIAACLRSA